MSLWSLIAMLSWVLLAAFYAGNELGFYSVNRLHLRRHAHLGNIRAKLLEKLFENPGYTITMLLIAVNCAEYFAVTKFTEIVTGFNPPVSPQLLTTLLMTPFMLIAAEIIPKNYYRLRPNEALYSSVRILTVSGYVLSPVVKIVGRFTEFVRRLTGRETVDEPHLTRNKLLYLLSSGKEHGYLTAYQNEMAENILHLGKKSVANIMTPWHKTFKVSTHETVADMYTKARLYGHTRFPLVDAQDGSVRAILNVLDYLTEQQQEGLTLSQFAREPKFFPADTPIDTVMFDLQKARLPFGIIIMRTGGKVVPVGIVTLKDLVEEVLGAF